MARMDQIMRDKNVQYSRASNSVDEEKPEIVLGSGDISDMNLVKLQ